MTEKKESIGVLWKKKTQKGEVLNGYIEVDGKKVRVNVWLNAFKKKDSEPDYRVYEDTYQKPVQHQQAKSGYIGNYNANHDNFNNDSKDDAEQKDDLPF